MAALPRRLALEPGDLPDERVMGERAPKPALAKYAHHRRRWMGEAPILPPEQPEGEVLRTDEKAREDVARRIAEHEQTPSTLQA